MRVPFWQAIFMGCLPLLVSLYFPQVHAQADTPNSPRPVDVNVQKQALQAKLAELQANGEIDRNVLEQAELDAQTARLKLENLTLEQQAKKRELDAALLEIERLDNELRALGPQAKNGSATLETSTRYGLLKEALSLKEKRKAELDTTLKSLEQQITEAKKQLGLRDEWHRSVLSVYQSQTSQDLRNEAETQRQKYEKQAEQLRSQLNPLDEEKSPETAWRRMLLEVEVLNAEERAQSVVRSNQLEAAETQIRQLTNLIEASRPFVGEPERMTQLLGELRSIETLLLDIQALNESKLKLLRHRTALILASDTGKLPASAKRANSKAETFLNKLIELYQQQSERTAGLLEKLKPLLNDIRDAYERNQTEALLLRRKLPASEDEWKTFWRELSDFPKDFYQQAQGITRIAAADLRAASLGQWLNVLALGTLWTVFIVWVRRKLLRRLQALDRFSKDSFARSTVWVFLQLLLKNLGGVLLAGWVLVFHGIIEMAPSTSALELSLIFIWLFFKLPLNLAWLLLAAPHVTAQYYSPKLYRQLRWVLILIGLLASLTLFIHVMQFPQTVRDVNDTVFMVFLSLLIYPLLQIQQLIMSPLHAHRKGYLMLALRVIHFLIPVSLFIVSLLGLIGYINLGWALARYLSGFIVVLTSWVIIRGLLNDGVIVLKRHVMSIDNQRGYFWSQDIIPPLHRLLELGLIFLAGWLFLLFNGWSTESEGFQQFTSFALLDFGENSVTIGKVFATMVVVFLVIWLARWSRQLIYRWAITNIEDNGVRHSLSTFTQYLIMLFGFLIAFQTLGVQLTALAVFAGAIGVGVGFGLQNIANNFISGLLLLAERPLRTGDIINIGGTHEGEVMRIGFRAMTIKTWDYQEVIVPNSEVISKPFTNWTYSDRVMRTLLKIQVSYQTDLEQAQQILQEIINNHDAILETPERGVLLEEFGNSAVVFRVFYYSNMARYDRLLLKSEILFAIWNSFKQHGIEIPYPQQDVYLREKPGA